MPSKLPRFPWKLLIGELELVKPEPDHRDRTELDFLISLWENLVAVQDAPAKEHLERRPALR